jgi:hypothetical protein
VSAGRRTVVFVSPAGAICARPRLFAALAEAFPVRFVDWTPGRRDGAGLIAIGTDGDGPVASDLPADVPVLALAGAPPPGTSAEPFMLGFGGGVDRRIRGITLTDRFAAAPLEGAAAHGDEVLAEAGSTPVWTVSRGAAPLHRLRSTLPELGSDDVLYALLSRHQLTAVALIQFLRGLCASDDWTPTPLRAAFLFDDPNLRWRSYGFIDYARLAAHADEHGYHAAMAMIPLDAGRPHGPTVDLFRRRADRLSVIVHGNDHTKGELLATDHDVTAQAIAAQAIRRIQRFERRSGLAVDRVMAPPHGLCSEPMTRALGAVGFDALTAIHPLPWTETPPADPLLAGWRPADFVAGCPVVPRIPLGSTAADIGLRAFLDHPLIVYGHHEDVADGFDALAETAAVINQLGDVRWSSIGDIVTGNVEQRAESDGLHLRPFSRRLVLAIGSDVSSVTVEAPPDSLDDASLTGFSVRGPRNAAVTGHPLPFGRVVALDPGDAPHLEIQLHGAADVEPRLVPAPVWRPWPKLRRAVTELRDRAIAQRKVPAEATSSPKTAAT